MCFVFCLLNWALLISRAADFGLVKIDHRGKVVQFNEKPKGADLEAMVGTHETLNPLFLQLPFQGYISGFIIIQLYCSK